MSEHVPDWSPAQVTGWLDRLGLAMPPAADATFLNSVQYHHLRTIPFETLDVAPLSCYSPLSLSTLYEKIVVSRRGGYCFELNGLLGSMLAALGYGVVAHPGHWVSEPAAVVEHYDHLVLEVTVPMDGSCWYVDVAAGRENPDGIVPLGGEAADGQHRTRWDGTTWLLERVDGSGGWQPRLAWLPEVCTLQDFQSRHTFFHTDPESPFRHQSLCTRLTAGGRTTIANRTLIVTEGGVRTETDLADDAVWEQALREHFGIQIAAS